MNKIIILAWIIKLLPLIGLYALIWIFFPFQAMVGSIVGFFMCAVVGCWYLGEILMEKKEKNE